MSRWFAALWPLLTMRMIEKRTDYVCSYVQVCSEEALLLWLRINSRWICQWGCLNDSLQEGNSSAFSSGGSKMQTCMSQRSGGKRRESRDKLWEASPKMNPVIKVHLSAVFRRKGSTNIVQRLIWKVAVLQLSSLRPPRPTPYPPASHPTAPATKGFAFSLISTERCSHRSPSARPRRCIAPLPRHH